MQIKIKSIQLDLTPSLKTYAEEKLGTLVKYISKYDAEGMPELTVELLRNTNHHHKGDVFQANLALAVPKKVLKATAEGTDIRQAIDIAKDALRSELEKYKSKSEDRTQRIKDEA